jgi:curli biogenesis system outer membrane secretion channel CsgG
MRKLLFFIFAGFFSTVCLSQEKVEMSKTLTQEAELAKNDLKRKIAVARFSDDTEFGKRIFKMKENDPTGKQAMDILSAKLAETEKFILFEKQDLNKIIEELKSVGNQQFQGVCADYLIKGSIIEFIQIVNDYPNALSKTKTQTYEVTVSICLIDGYTGKLIYSEEAKGKAEAADKEILFSVENPEFNPSLFDKAILDAISKLVEKITNSCMSRPWRTYFLNSDLNGIVISGGRSQGLKINDILGVKENGKSIGKIQIISVGGETVENEFSVALFIEGTIDSEILKDFYIEEIR